MLSSLATKQKVGSHLAWLSYSFPPPRVLNVCVCVCVDQTPPRIVHLPPPLLLTVPLSILLLTLPLPPSSTPDPPPPLLTSLTSSPHPSCIHAFTLWAESINISWKKKQKNNKKEPRKKGNERRKKQRSRTD